MCIGMHFHGLYLYLQAEEMSIVDEADVIVLVKLPSEREYV
jgi:hypothetical protein